MREKLDDMEKTLESAILDLLNRRDPGKTICPSDAARSVAPNSWRPLMEQTRAAARRLVARGQIVMTRRGKVVDPTLVRGAVRLRKI
jgi:hypothetical protein